MIEPKFLLQSGPCMSTEKLACSFSNYPVQHCKYEHIESLNPEEARLKFIPVGSVEFTKAYCDHVGLSLPTSMSYPEQLEPFLLRPCVKSTYSEASLTDFVKPYKEIKLFTGGIKGHIEIEFPDSVDPETPIWKSPCVPFGAEFRFYIQSFHNGGKILGWSRYDDYEGNYPEPDVGLVESIMSTLEADLAAPGAYSIDIGWRIDLDRYCLVEINDGWSLGLYENKDPQSNPPTRQQYADMLMSRWTQILFCNLV